MAGAGATVGQRSAGARVADRGEVAGTLAAAYEPGVDDTGWDAEI